MLARYQIPVRGFLKAGCQRESTFPSVVKQAVTVNANARKRQAPGTSYAIVENPVFGEEKITRWVMWRIVYQDQVSLCVDLFREVAQA